LILPLNWELHDSNVNGNVGLAYERTFAQNAIAWARDLNFDGIVIDFTQISDIDQNKCKVLTERINYLMKVSQIRANYLPSLTDTSTTVCYSTWRDCWHAMPLIDRQNREVLEYGKCQKNCCC
jgi:hypothetical protein